MLYGSPFDYLTPENRVGMAVAPVAIALLLRLILGKSEFTRWSLAVGTLWFAINVLMAPYSEGIREGLMDVRSRFQ